MEIYRASGRALPPIAKESTIPSMHEEDVVICFPLGSESLVGKSRLQRAIRQPARLESLQDSALFLRSRNG